MSARILSNITSFEYEPDILTDNGRDGITSFQFSVVGTFTALTSNFALDQDVAGVPDQPPGLFKVVRRNLSHIAGDALTGLYRLQVSAEGGAGDNSLFVLETSYQYQKEIVTGIITLNPNSKDFSQFAFQYILEFLSPSVTITTNSRQRDVGDVQARVKAIAFTLEPQIIRNKPPSDFNRNVSGPGIDMNNVYIVGSSVENAGGLFRVRASASRGSVEIIL
jgi:hypothetical protein